MKITVGSTSSQKIGYLEEVLNELEIKASLIPVEVSSEISNQPLSSNETKKGSINRAKNALSKTADCDFAIGIEVGYHPNKKGEYKMFCYTTIIDPKGKKVSAKSHQLLLPDFYQKLLKDNKYLSDYVDQYLSENQNPPYKQLAVILKTREPLIKTAVKTAIFNYSTKK